MTLPYSVQGGYKNYHQNPGKVRTVELPENWQSGPGEPTTHPAFITEEEQDLLRMANLHGKENPDDIGKGRGPGELPSYDGYGEQASSDAGTSGDFGDTAMESDFSGLSDQQGTPAGGGNSLGVGGALGDLVSRGADISGHIGGFGDYASISGGDVSAKGYTPQQHAQMYGKAPVATAHGYLSADTETGFVSSGMDVNAEVGQGFGVNSMAEAWGPGTAADLAARGIAPLAAAYSTEPTGMYGPPMEALPSTMEVMTANIDQLAEMMAAYGPPDFDNELGPYAGAFTTAEQYGLAEQAAEEADSGFMDSLSDFVFSPNEVVYDDEGFPHMSAHAYDFFNSGLTKGLLGLASPVLGGVYSVGSSIANDNPAELAYGVLGGIAAPFSVADLGTKALSWADVGENLSFSDLDPRGFDAEGALASLSPSNMYDNAMSWYDGLDTGTTLTGGSANDAFGGGAANYGTPAPAPSYSVGGDTGQVVDPTTVPSMFTMLGEQIAHNDPFWYGGKRFFDEGEQVDIGDSYGLA